MAKKTKSHVWQSHNSHHHISHYITFHNASDSFGRSSNGGSDQAVPQGAAICHPSKDLRQWLWSWGIEVQSLVLHYSDPKKLRCSAFLHFSEDARHHVPALNGSWFGQHQLECSVAKPKVARFLGWNCWVCAIWETTWCLASSLSEGRHSHRSFFGSCSGACWEQLEREREREQHTWRALWGITCWEDGTWRERERERARERNTFLCKDWWSSWLTVSLAEIGKIVVVAPPKNWDCFL